MNGKVKSSKTVLLFCVSLFVSLLMVLLDPIAMATNEFVTMPMIMLIVVGAALSVILACIVLNAKESSTILALLGFLLTIGNVSIIAFFFYFGANFA